MKTSDSGLIEEKSVVAPQSTSAVRAGELQVVWTLWFTYGAFYFCRNNLSVALPGIESELGYNKTTMGLVLLALKVTYGCGQFVNGQLAEIISPRKMLAIGMLASAALNVAFGFGTGFYFFLFVWGCNGYVQSLGWTPCVRVIGNWVPVLRRGKAMGIVGTGYQLTAALTYLVSGFSVWLLGWRGALWIPPAILALAALGMLLLLRESPEHHQARTTGEPAPAAAPRISFGESLRLTLTNPALWLLAISLGMLNASRYGFVDWGVSHLVAIERARSQREQINQRLTSGELSEEQRGRLNGLLELDLVQDSAQKEVKAATKDGLLPEAKQAEQRLSVLNSAIQYAVLPVGAILGAFLTGWMTDRFFGSRRAPTICTLLVLLGGLALVYDPIARTSFTGTMILLIAVGFCIYGPQVLLVGTAPADLARQGTAAAAAGFVNCFGYFGAALAGDLLTGYLAGTYGWTAAIYSWAFWAFAAAAVTALLWNATGKD
jgi:sugar phosphate permease